MRKRTGPSNLRIHAGRLRGRKLLPPPAKATTRPMTGLAKKSLFGILGPHLAGATVLDLYCGTGTLGLEALSQGAARCCFAESDRAVLGRLERNIDTCSVRDESMVWAGNLESRLAYWLEALDGEVDLVFLDPPYAAARRWNWAKIERKIIEPLAARLADDGVLILRLPGDTPAPETLGPLKQTRTKTYGDMVIAFYEMTIDDFSKKSE